MNENYEYKSIKVPIRKIIKNIEYLKKIDDVVQRAHLLTIQSFMFLKYYFLHISSEKNYVTPEINLDFIKLIFKVLYTKNNKKSNIISNLNELKKNASLPENNSLFDKLKKFNDQVYNKVLDLQLIILLLIR
jgi:hypothetical protein